MIDRIAIPMPAGAVDRLEAAAMARGMTLDELVEGALADVRPTFVGTPGATTVVIRCDCCPGTCRQPFRWRSTHRCGCPR